MEYYSKKKLYHWEQTRQFDFIHHFWEWKLEKMSTHVLNVVYFCNLIFLNFTYVLEVKIVYGNVLIFFFIFFTPYKIEQTIKYVI